MKENTGKGFILVVLITLLFWCISMQLQIAEIAKQELKCANCGEPIKIYHNQCVPRETLPF